MIYRESYSVLAIIDALCGSNPVHAEDRYEFVKETIRTAYQAGVDDAYDECGVIRGDDAQRLLATLEQNDLAMTPDKLAHMRLCAKVYLAEVSKPKPMCGHMSPGDPDCEDPDGMPSACTKKPGHTGQHMAGCRGGTIAWD